mmetsp:Transcript_25594/g.47224  ORF Transcript_25594/g.47224 Transcript_25594/m.47224 type:complete len:200 (-) Transcript_25594:1608-2207(-)
MRTISSFWCFPGTSGCSTTAKITLRSAAAVHDVTSHRNSCILSCNLHFLRSSLRSVTVPVMKRDRTGLPAHAHRLLLVACSSTGGILVPGTLSLCEARGRMHVGLRVCVKSAEVLAALHMSVAACICTVRVLIPSSIHVHAGGANATRRADVVHMPLGTSICRYSLQIMPRESSSSVRHSMCLEPLRAVRHSPWVHGQS